MTLKKISLLMLVLALMVSTQMTTFADDAFTDIDQSPYKEDIQLLYNNGIVGGVGQGAYAPERAITNAESLQLLNAYLDLSLAKFSFIKAPQVTDYYNVAGNEGWYQDALIISAVNGLPVDQDLVPNAAIDRESFYFLLVKGLEQRYNLPMVKIDPVDISDGIELTPDRQAAIQRALSMGLADLDDKDAFRPHETLSRAEAAHAIADAIWLMEGYVPEDIPQDLPQDLPDSSQESDQQ